MDIFQAFNYLNKLSFIAFLVTLGVIGYQIYQLKKDKSLKHDDKIVIPDFNENMNIKIDNYTKIDVNKYMSKQHQPINPLVMVGMAATFLLIVVLLVTIYNRSTKSPNNTQLIKYESSKGISVYNHNWELLNDEQLILLKPKDKIIITIATISDPYIDKARIKVNSSGWKTNDETKDFDKKINGYYKQYVIATNEVELKIEAQLHSSIDGWLGD